jgi:hypothetical protein
MYYSAFYSRLTDADISDHMKLTSLPYKGGGGGAVFYYVLYIYISHGSTVG